MVGWIFSLCSVGRLDYLTAELIERFSTLDSLYRDWNSKINVISRKDINKAGHNALSNGLIYLKGGELETEVKAYSRIATLYSVSDFFSEEYFQTKKAVYLPL